MIVLGLETSCDDTAAAVLQDGEKLLSNVINDQARVHSKFGGIVPELAGRSHVDQVQKVIRQSLKLAQVELSQIDLISVTASTTFLRRPGDLFGGLGFGFGAIGFLILFYLFGIWILNNIYNFSFGAIGDRPLFLLGILLVIISVQLISLGVVAELIIKSYKVTESTIYIKDKTE